MSSISSMMGAGFSPAQHMQQMGERFAAADVDGSGTVSKAEATDALSARGVDSAKIDKMFDRMDTDQNGEISQQEHDDMVTKMEDRMRDMMGGSYPRTGGGAAASSGFMELLEALVWIN